MPRPNSAMCLPEVLCYCLSNSSVHEHVVIIINFLCPTVTKAWGDEETARKGEESERKAWISMPISAGGEKTQLG